MKYINIKIFINLTKLFTNSELVIFLTINLIQNAIRIFTFKNIKKILPFYSNRTIKNTLHKLIKFEYINKIDSNKYYTRLKFVDLTGDRNNLIGISLDIVKKYKKQVVLFYKYKIFELFCNDLLVKQERLKEVLNISQYDIRQFEKYFEMNCYHQSMKIQGYVKFMMGQEDRNIREYPHIFTSLPNQYIFYPCTDKIIIKTNQEYINRVRRFLIHKHLRERSCYVGISPKSAHTDKVNVNIQLLFLYTKFVEEKRKYSYKIEKQLTELFPYFVKRNEARKHYKLCYNQLV